MPRLPARVGPAALSATAAAAIGFYGLIAGEVAFARRRIGTTDEVPPKPDGVYGIDMPGTPVRLLMLGDSTTVGYGMHSADATPPALAAIGMSHLIDRPVDVRSFAVVGARSTHLIDQITEAFNAENDEWDGQHADFAMILIGANDVTHSIPRAVAARQLARTVRLLRSHGTEVIVGTCPDLGTVQRLPQPLRVMARRRSRNLARAQAIAALKAGARVVSLADSLGELLADRSDEMFGFDSFHPSATGYANMVSFLVASAAAAWRERTGDIAPHEDMSLDAAAHEAAEHAGTELVPARGGRWASVFRRRR